MDILIVKTSSLGDIIHAFPILPYLKERYPGANIDWVVEQPFAEMVKAHPMVNQVFEIQTKKWRKQIWKGKGWRELISFRRSLRQRDYDLVLDLQGNVKSALVTANAKSSLKVGFGRSTVTEWPNLLATNKRYNPPQGLNIRQDYLFLAQSALGDFSDVADQGIQLRLTEGEVSHYHSIVERLHQQPGLKVMICPGSNWANKQLSQETLHSFLHSIASMSDVYFVFVWGNQMEKEIGEQLRIAFPSNSVVMEKLTLPILQNLMGRMDLVLAMDSLPLHLAGTTSTPTYSVFGASSANKYKPLGATHQAFQGGCPYGKNFVKRCDTLRTCPTGSCIKDLEGQALFNDFKQWWQAMKSRV
jgi:heptosyltransferase-1